MIDWRGLKIVVIDECWRRWVERLEKCSARCETVLVFFFAAAAETCFGICFEILNLKR